MKRTISTDWYKRFAEAMRRGGYSQAGLARAVGCKRGTVHKWLHGLVMDPEYHYIAEACRILGVSPEWVLYGHGPEDPATGRAVTSHKRVPVVGTAQLGPDGFWHELGYPPGGGAEEMDVPTTDTNAYALQVRGDSMAPAIRDGWYVIVEPSHDPTPGEYVMVTKTTGESMVKELLWQRGDQIALMSAADGYERLTLRLDEIEKLHAITSVVPPSKARHL